MNHFANNLKKIRKVHGLTQPKLAELTRIPKHRIGAYEEGRSEPNIDALIVLSSTLKITIDTLCKGDFSKT